MAYYENIKDWRERISDKPALIWVYRRIFTPYEQENKFSDESVYEDYHATVGFIKGAVILPDGDVLLEVVPIDEDTNEPDETLAHQYYKLSEIRLAVNFADLTEEYDEDDDEDDEDICIFGFEEGDEVGY